MLPGLTDMIAVLADLSISTLHPPISPPTLFTSLPFKELVKEVGLDAGWDKVWELPAWLRLPWVLIWADVVVMRAKTWSVLSGVTFAVDMFAVVGLQALPCFVPNADPFAPPLFPKLGGNCPSFPLPSQ